MITIRKLPGDRSKPTFHVIRLGVDGEATIVAHATSREDATGYARLKVMTTKTTHVAFQADSGMVCAVWLVSSLRWRCPVVESVCPGGAYGRICAGTIKGLKYPEIEKAR